MSPLREFQRHHLEACISRGAEREQRKSYTGYC